MGQIGTLKLQTSSGTVKVPVYASGDSGSSIHENLRIQTSSGTGFIPLADSSSAKHNYLRIQTSNHGLVAVHDSATLGLTEITNFLEDDWGDNAVSSRSSTSDGVYTHPSANKAGNVLIGRYRPSWTVSSGSISASSGRMQFAGGGSEDKAKLESAFMIGSWTVDFQKETTSSSSGAFNIITISVSLTFHPNDGYYISIDNKDSDYVLYEITGGTRTGIVSATWGFDTSTHTAKTTRDSYGNHELFYDGASQGTAADTNHTKSNTLGFRSAADDDWNVDNLVVN